MHAGKARKRIADRRDRRGLGRIVARPVHRHRRHRRQQVLRKGLAHKQRQRIDVLGAHAALLRHGRFGCGGE